MIRQDFRKAALITVVASGSGSPAFGPLITEVTRALADFWASDISEVTFVRESATCVASRRAPINRGYADLSQAGSPITRIPSSAVALFTAMVGVAVRNLRKSLV